MINQSQTSLWFEIVWAMFQYTLPTLQLYFMFDSYAQERILTQDMWLPWVIECIFFLLSVMNYDYLYGSTAKYFDIQSTQSVKRSTTAALVFSCFSGVAFAAYCYIAKKDYEDSENNITDAVPIDI